MIIYLRDRFGENQKAVTCYKYTYYNDNNHDSSFEISGIYPGNYAGGLYEGGYVLVPNPEIGYPHVSVISTMTPATKGDPHTTIKTNPIINLFDRKVEWLTSYDNGQYKNVIESIFNTNFGTGQSDPLYKYANNSGTMYVTLQLSSTATVKSPEEKNLDEINYFDLLSWIKEREKRNEYVLRAYPTDSGITITDNLSDEGSSNVYLQDSRYILSTESYKDDRIGRISNHTKGEGESSWTVTDYYLKNDGTVATSRPSKSSRVKGVWEHVINKSEGDVNSQFNGKKYEHKIKIKAYGWKKHAGNIVHVNLGDGRTLDSVITCVGCTEGSDLIEYEFGNLPTTLLDELKEKDSEKSSSSSSGSSGGDYETLRNLPRINNVTITGNNNAAHYGLGTYSKPSSGIPRTDMSSDVNTTLTKADTAVQPSALVNRAEINSYSTAVSNRHIYVGNYAPDYVDTTGWETGSLYITTEGVSSNIPTRLSQLTDDLGNDPVHGHYYNRISGLSTVGHTGSYTDLVDVPAFATVATSGSYTDLINKPTLATVATSGSYTDLADTPVLATVATTGLYSDVIGTPALSTVATSGSYNDLTNKPTIPHIVVGNTPPEDMKESLQDNDIYIFLRDLQGV